MGLGREGQGWEAGERVKVRKGSDRGVTYRERLGEAGMNGSE